MSPTPELFDFDDLDRSEEKELFGKAPSRFVFGGNPCLVAQRRLPNENRPEDTGSEVWPASVALARYLERQTLGEDVGTLAAFLAQGKGSGRGAWQSGGAVQGRRVLELGAGLGLVGLVARALGARRVFLTDVPVALPWLNRNVELNRRKGTCQVLELDWYKPEASSLSRDSIDLVCCSDCVLWPDLFEPLCNTLDYFMGDQTVALLSVVHRCDQVDDFFPVLERRMQFEEVWASKKRVDSDAGRIRIYRVWRHGVAREQKRADNDYLSTTVLERLVGVPEGSIEEFDLGSMGIRRGVHSLACEIALTPSTLAPKAAVPPSVFIKQVVPSWREKTAQPGHGRVANAETAWLQDATTYQVEINWFDHFNEELRSRGIRLPRCFAVWSEGANMLAELKAAGAVAPSGDAAAGVSLAGQGMRTADVSSNFVSVLEDLAEPGWTQHLYLSEAHVQATLGMLADFHGATMGDDELLEDAREALHEHGTYWAPVHRPAGELEQLEACWEGFVREFQQLDEELFARPEVRALGSRLRAAQAEVDEGLRGSASRRVLGRTLLHGDLRTANLFFAAEPSGGTEVVPVNFRWAGLGLCAQDVAYLLISSAELAVLASGKALRRLISGAYLKPLRRKVGSFAAPSEAEFFRTFRLACLDYAKVVWGQHLAHKKPDWLRAASQCLGWCAHNRSVEHALGLVRFVARLLEGIEVPGFAD